MIYLFLLIVSVYYSSMQSGPLSPRPSHPESWVYMTWGRVHKVQVPVYGLSFQVQVESECC